MTPDLTSYDRIIVAVSGGKDGTACLLALLEAGALKDRLELWHHEVDGQGPSFMDWPSTSPYVSALAPGSPVGRGAGLGQSEALECGVGAAIPHRLLQAVLCHLYFWRCAAVCNDPLARSCPL